MLTTVRIGGGCILILAASGANIACDNKLSVPPFRHSELYEHVQMYAQDFTLREGDYKEDYGDAANWGVAYYGRVDKAELANAHTATDLYRRNLQVIQNTDLVTGDANEAVMAMLGVIDYSQAHHIADFRILTDGIAQLNALLTTLDYYLPAEIGGGWAMQNYGPVSINALFALINLQYTSLLAIQDQGPYVAMARKIVTEIDSQHWNGTYYEFGANRDGLICYPNITMILVNARLFQLTGDRHFKQRAIAAYRGIQPLRVSEASGWSGPGRYRSPYSQVEMGAQTDDYSTLSSENYLMLALMLLAQITHDNTYIDEVDAILDFIQNDLIGNWCISHVHHNEVCEPICAENVTCVDTVCTAESCHKAVLHHWIDGRIANTQDPYLLCSGCNLQLLYVMWYRQKLAKDRGD